MSETTLFDIIKDCKSIDEYFSYFPHDIKIIDVPYYTSNYFDYVHIPDLSRFHQLEELKINHTIDNFIHFSNIPSLSSTLIHFTIKGINIDKLPTLPSKLQSLYINRTYITSLPNLPDTLEELDCNYNKIKHLPKLPQGLKYLRCGYNLIAEIDQELPPNLRLFHCFDNKLTSLPQLPPKLDALICSSNKLTYLPDLPSTLKILKCGNNNLTKLPSLIKLNLLTELQCSENQLFELPILPMSLKYLFCNFNNLISIPDLPSSIIQVLITDNPLPYNITHSTLIMMRNVRTAHRFKELYYALKFKKQFRDWLWVKVREPKIREKYHPRHLKKMLEGREEITLDELDELNENW